MNSGTTAASSGAHGAARHYTGGKGVGRQSWIQVSKTLSDETTFRVPLQQRSAHGAGCLIRMLGARGGS